MRNLQNKLAKTDVKESNVTRKGGWVPFNPQISLSPKEKKELTREIIKDYKNNKQLNCN